MRAFETLSTTDPDTLEKNWRAYAIEDVQAYVHGEPMIKPNARFGVGRSENEAIANLCAQAEGEEGLYLYLPTLPKYQIGQRILVNVMGWRGGSYGIIGYYRGTIVGIYGITGSFSSVCDYGNGMAIVMPYEYYYTIEEYDGTKHREVTERQMELDTDDGA